MFTVSRTSFRQHALRSTALCLPLLFGAGTRAEPMAWLLVEGGASNQVFSKRCQSAAACSMKAKVSDRSDRDKAKVTALGAVDGQSGTGSWRSSVTARGATASAWASLVGGPNDLSITFTVPGAQPDTRTPATFSLILVGAVTGDTPREEAMTATLRVIDLDQVGHPGHGGELIYRSNGTTSVSGDFNNFRFEVSDPHTVTISGTLDLIGPTSTLQAASTLHAYLSYGPAPYALGTGTMGYQLGQTISAPNGVTIEY